MIAHIVCESWHDNKVTSNMKKDLTLGQDICYYLRSGESSLDLIPEDMLSCKAPVSSSPPFGDANCSAKSHSPS